MKDKVVALGDWKLVVTTTGFLAQRIGGEVMAGKHCYENLQMEGLMRGRRFLAALLTPFMMLLNCPVMAAPTAGGTEAKPLTEIFHKPIETAESGKRVTVYTEVEDPDGVDVVRVYFKSQDVANYNFVPMVESPLQEKGLFEKFKSLGSDFKGLPFSAVLPAPAKGSKGFDYLILIKNKANKVVKSQSYQVTVVDGKDEAVASKEPIKVYSELAEVPKEVPGFTDSITLDVVESGAKFGAVAGLYSTMTSGGGGAISGGTVAASAGGFTTTAAVIGGVAAVAVVGGTAAVAGGGGSSSGSSGGGGEALTSRTIVGNWNVREVSAGYSNDYTFVFYDNGTCNGGGQPGTWRLVGTTLTLNNGASDWVATVSGNSQAFTARGPSTMYFTR